MYTISKSKSAGDCINLDGRSYTVKRLKRVPPLDGGLTGDDLEKFKQSGVDPGQSYTPLRLHCRV